jgi:hypothetical protein
MNIIESQGHRSAVAIENGSATALRVRRDNFASHAQRSRVAVAIDKPRSDWQGDELFVNFIFSFFFYFF